MESGIHYAILGREAVTYPDVEQLNNHGIHRGRERESSDKGEVCRKQRVHNLLVDKLRCNANTAKEKRNQEVGTTRKAERAASDVFTVQCSRQQTEVR